MARPIDCLNQYLGDSARIKHTQQCQALPELKCRLPLHVQCTDQPNPLTLPEGKSSAELPEVLMACSLACIEAESNTWHPSHVEVHEVQ